MAKADKQERGDEKVNSAAGDQPQTSPAEQFLIKDPERFALNLARMIEQAGKAASAWVEPRERGEVRDTVAEPVADMVKTFSKLTEYWLSDPQRALEAQTRLFSGYLDVWTNSIRRAGGEQPARPVEPERGDKRFQDPEWGRNAFFDFLKQAYLVTSRWAGDLAERGRRARRTHPAQGRLLCQADHQRHLAVQLHPHQPRAVSRDRRLERREPGARHAHAGRRHRRRQRRPEAQAGRLFALRDRQEHRRDAGQGDRPQRRGGDPSVQPSTEKVLKRPLLICPPWINKFYILDLNPEKSFIRWAVGQGHSVFVISWINPDERHGTKGWEAYIREGLQFALDTVEQATGEREVNAIGYCVGGTLLAAALALFAQEGESRIRSATFFTTQVDFTHAGDLKVFVDEDQIAALEKSMGEKRLSRRHQDGDRLQHAALGRPDLALCRQQLHARQANRRRSTCFTGTPIRPAWRPPTIRSICAIATSRTICRWAEWRWPGEP